VLHQHHTARLLDAHRSGGTVRSGAGLGDRHLFALRRDAFEQRINGADTWRAMAGFDRLRPEDALLWRQACQPVLNRSVRISQGRKRKDPAALVRVAKQRSLKRATGPQRALRVAGRTPEYTARCLRPATGDRGWTRLVIEDVTEPGQKRQRFENLAINEASE